jgi:hypothetical protein
VLDSADNVIAGDTVISISDSNPNESPEPKTSTLLGSLLILAALFGTNIGEASGWEGGNVQSFASRLAPALTEVLAAVLADDAFPHASSSNAALL